MVAATLAPRQHDAMQRAAVWTPVDLVLSNCWTSNHGLSFVRMGDPRRLPPKMTSVSLPGASGFQSLR